MIGDKLLQHIGQFLKNQLEKGELLFHCDGANFALLCSCREKAKAMPSAAPRP
ncbi:MAG: hypothetical protein ACKVJG_25695 [Candidatus Latescibacterota bacterium]